MKYPCRIALIVPFLAAVALAQQSLTVTMQPQPQNAQAGQTATFTAKASNPNCRTLIYKNGAFVKYGPTTGADGVVSYTTPVLALTDNGEKYSFQFYGCGGEATTAEALLTVNSTTVTLTVTGAAIFDDGTPIMANATANVLEWEGADASGNPIWNAIGTVSSDAQGKLSGLITVDYSFTSDGLVGLSLSMSGVPAPGSEWVQPGSFQHGSTGLTVMIVLWKSDLTAKSGTLNLTP